MKFLILLALVLPAPAWAYDPCNGLRQAVENMKQTSDPRLADYQRRLEECNAAAAAARGVVK